MNKYITTTLPYLNSTPHIGHCFEFVIADVLAGYYRLNPDNKVFFNVGVDEHGQKVFQKAIEEGFENTQEYCDAMALKWVEFCSRLSIKHDNFYRTTSAQHKENVLRFYSEIKQHTFVKEYEGLYCVGCESFITEKDAVGGKCPIHNKELVLTKETNRFFDISKFAEEVQDNLIDKSKSEELKNIIEDKFDLSITRQHVKWGIPTGDGDQVFYVWFEALLNYIFAIKYYEDHHNFFEFWNCGDPLIICGKDNLKFQAYILPSLLLSNDIEQCADVLVHGNILDSSGHKMSKSVGNVIDPIDQVNKYGLDAIRYYLIFGLNTFYDSKYSEPDLIRLWNNDVVNGLGNLISRLLHLIDLRQVVPDRNKLSEECMKRILVNKDSIDSHFEIPDFRLVGLQLNDIISKLNRRITIEKPFGKDCENYFDILNEIYFELLNVIPYYKIILPNSENLLREAFSNNKKAIVFQKINDVKQ